MRVGSPFAFVFWSALLGACLAPSAPADDSCARKVAGLPADAVTSLRAAGGWRSYAIRVLVNDRGQTVVLLGETHRKSRHAADLGRAVVDAFPRIGVEGADAGEYWGGRCFALTVRACHALIRVLSLGLLSGRSTIEEAYARKDREIIELEEGHVPDLNEQFFSVSLPALVALLAADGAAKIAGVVWTDPQTLAVSHAIQLGTTAVAVPGMVATIGGLALQWLRRGGRTGILGHRNATMAGNIEKYLEADPGRDTLLVVIGRAHVPGLAAALEERFQYRTVPLR